MDRGISTRSYYRIYEPLLEIRVDCAESQANVSKIGDTGIDNKCIRYSFKCYSRLYPGWARVNKVRVIVRKSI